MKEKEIHLLIEKYLAGQATDSEKEILHQWYNHTNNTDALWELEGEGVNDVKKRIKNNIWQSTIQKKDVAWYLTWKPYVAAAILLIIGISTLKSNLFWEDKIIASTPIEQLENKYVLFPDSSVVILRSGSTVKYDDKFDGAIRMVELIGEGYFDVRKKDGVPFVIKTGDVTTTVLGTAFSIKATEGDEKVEVKVAHGKVRVERENKVLAVLIADQQLVYYKDQAQSTQYNSSEKSVKEELSWTEKDMYFDAMRFQDLANKLERRYGVKIEFLDESLTNYSISGVFSGTENLDEVLYILCKTSNSSYSKIEDNLYHIKLK